MRREGFELAVGKPRVVYREINGENCEPFEVLTVDVEDTNQGAVMEELGRRRGDLQDMQPDGHGRVRLEYRIPARGLIGFQSEFMTLTRGTGIMAHVFDDYAPVKADMPGRRTDLRGKWRGSSLRIMEAGRSRANVRVSRRQAL
jgi:GTP-binding protein